MVRRVAAYLKCIFLLYLCAQYATSSYFGSVKSKAPSWHGLDKSKLIQVKQIGVELVGGRTRGAWAWAAKKIGIFKPISVLQPLR